MVDEAGRPVAKAQVTLLAPAGGSSWRPAQSRDDGTFESPAVLPGGTYEVRAQLPGRVSAAQKDVAAGSTDVRLVLAKGLTSSGRLVDAAGRPMPNARLSFASIDGENEQTAQTDADGKFAVGGLSAGTYAAKVAVVTADSEEWKDVGSLKAGATGMELRATR